MRKARNLVFYVTSLKAVRSAADRCNPFTPRTSTTYREVLRAELDALREDDEIDDDFVSAVFKLAMHRLQADHKNIDAQGHLRPEAEQVSAQFLFARRHLADECDLAMNASAYEEAIRTVLAIEVARDKQRRILKREITIKREITKPSPYAPLLSEEEIVLGIKAKR